jgi:predicted DNA binding CopG/RHH family protein
MKRESRKLKPSIRSVPIPLDQEVSFIFGDSEDSVKLEALLRHIPKDKTIALRLPSGVLNQFKKLADKKNKKYQKLMFEALIEYLVKNRT